LPPPGNAPVTAVALTEGEGVTVPLLVGKTVREVIEICQRLGINPLLAGSGIVLEQQPQAGTAIARGGTVTLRFGRTGAERSSLEPRLTDPPDKRLSAMRTGGGR
jgi:beta-lactam-binding protein with PASTA domain